jgi:rhamnulose-1-phosphate aldolase
MYDVSCGNSGITCILEKISEISGNLWQKGWAERNAGNISWNLTGIVSNNLNENDFGPAIILNSPVPNLANQILLATGTGTRMRDIWKRPAENTCILQIDKNGRQYRIFVKNDASIGLRPTSELPSHLAIHNMLAATKRSERVVIHTHPNNLIALTHIEEFCDESRINNLLWGIQPETCVYVADGLGFVPYLMTGTEELAVATILALQLHRVILWEKHGCLAVANDTDEAFDLIDILDKSASIFFTCKNAGYQVGGINNKEIDKLKLFVCH